MSLKSVTLKCNTMALLVREKTSGHETLDNFPIELNYIIADILNIPLPAATWYHNTAA